MKSQKNKCQKANQLIAEKIPCFSSIIHSCKLRIMKPNDYRIVLLKIYT